MRNPARDWRFEQHCGND